MKIQFIVVGWHFDKYPNLINDLIELNSNNENIDVFWTCHREPSQIIKDNFAYKVFPNLGLEDGAYQQALDYLELSDDTILFLIHDDIIVKDWNFINICLSYLSDGFTFIGNGMNYPLEFDPFDSRNVDIIGYVKQDARHLFDRKQFTLTLRESFICTTRKYLRDIFDFEVMWQEPIPDINGNYHIGSIGNAQQTLLGYKITRVFGADRITYLSNTYMDSEYLYECGRGINEKEYE
jgi:hypothetical protein